MHYLRSADDYKPITTKEKLRKALPAFLLAFGGLCLGFAFGHDSAADETQETRFTHIEIKKEDYRIVRAYWQWNATPEDHAAEQDWQTQQGEKVTVITNHGPLILLIK